MKMSFEIWPNMPWGRLDNCGPAWNSWGDKPLDWCIRQIAQYGYDGFDVVYPKLEEIHPEDHDSEAAKIKAAMKETGLVFSSIGCHTTFVSYRWFDRERGIARFKKAIDWAAELNCDDVTTLIGDGYYDPPLYNLITREDAWNQVISATKEVCEYALDKKVKVSIELIQGTIINSVEAMLRLFKEVDMPNLYCCIDTGTWYTTVKPKIAIPEAVRMIGKDRIRMVHVKDEVGFPNIIQSQHVWFGGGYVNFREMSDALKDVGYDGYCTVEWEAWQAGGLFGVGEPSCIGLTDFDRVAKEARSYLLEEGW
jgi:sugar phosphate isomerase/epimerase